MDIYEIDLCAISSALDPFNIAGNECDRVVTMLRDLDPPYEATIVHDRWADDGVPRLMCTVIDRGNFNRSLSITDWM